MTLDWQRNGVKAYVARHIIRVLGTQAIVDNIKLRLDGKGRYAKYIPI
jgi:hypothetical protein